MKAIKWLAMKHAPLILRPRADMAMVKWMLAMLGNCNARDYAINKSRMVRLAEFSRDCLIELRAQTGISYDERMQGTLNCSARKVSWRASPRMWRCSKPMACLSKFWTRPGVSRPNPVLPRLRRRLRGLAPAA
jgi:hypothetical protein